MNVEKATCNTLARTITRQDANPNTYNPSDDFSYQRGLQTAYLETPPEYFGIRSSDGSLMNDLFQSISPRYQSMFTDTLEYGLELERKAHTVLNDFVAIREKFSDNKMCLLSLERSEKLIYLALMARQSNNDELTDQERQKYADVFTSLSIELYGAPDADLANDIECHGIGNFLSSIDDIRGGVQEYLSDKYPGFFDNLGLEDDKLYETPSICHTFNVALDYLKQQDKDWGDWQIVWSESTLIETKPELKQIWIGKNRSPETGAKLKGIIAHELLRHAQSAVNGAKTGDTLMELGMPGYGNAEEGIAILFDFAITGNISEKAIDRYVNIAAALGLIRLPDGTTPKLLRSELTAKATERSKSRSPNKNETEIELEIIPQIARIYQGTPGNQAISGVYTQGAMYLNGLIDVCNYIREEIAKGRTVPEIIDYMMRGKFDPNNVNHREYEANL